MGTILSFILEFFSSLRVANFLALKMLLYTLLVVILPVVLWNLKIDIIEYLFQKMMEFAGDSQNVFVSISGLAAWILDTMQINKVLEVLVSAYATRLVISFLKP